MKAYHFSLIFVIYFVPVYGQFNDQASIPVSMDSLFRAKAKESIGKPFPDFNALFEEKKISLDAIKGKVTFINFWFEACPPCIAELPALNELYQKLKRDKRFTMLSFTYESPARIKILKKKYHLQYPVASVNSQECYRLNQNNGFPTSIIVGADGKIVELYTGGDTNSVVARDMIQNVVYPALLAELKNVE